MTQRGIQDLQSLKVAIVGLGNMGRRHVRVLRSLPELYQIIAVHDPDEAAAKRIADELGIPPSRSPSEAFAAAQVAFIATPTITHSDLARQAIDAGCHIFVEKPLADTMERGTSVVQAAQKAGLRVAVGHTERFNPVVVWLHTALAEETILSLNIERIGPRPPRIKDVGIVADLGVHDLDLIAHLTGSPIADIACLATATQGEHEDVAQILVKLRSGAVGAINTNWLTPFKSRRVFVATRRKMLVGDLVRFTGQIFSNISETNMNQYAVEDASIAWQEPLMAQAKAVHGYFAHEARSPVITGEEALEVLFWVSRCLVDMKRR